MPNFILLYNGPATAPADMSSEQRNGIMEAWMNWMERTGSALVDMGAPMANGRSVVDDGSTGAASALNGYTIVQADSMDDALKLVDGHPFLSDGAGNFSVEVHELTPIPM